MAGSDGARAQAAQENPDLLPQPAGLPIGCSVLEPRLKLPTDNILPTLSLWQEWQRTTSSLVLEVARTSKMWPHAEHLYS